MLVLFILLNGLTLDIPEEYDCSMALHSLRTEGKMEITSTDLDNKVMIYTLTEKAHHWRFNSKKNNAKTAILGCEINSID